jgi:hypothetical protein
MRSRSGCGSTLLLAVAWLAAPGDARAFAFGVEEWSAAWEGFSDDFEDGVLEDGEEGEATWYAAVCGAFGDQGEGGAIEETGGALVLSGPNAPCGGAIAGAAMGTPEPAETRATFRLAVPELGGSYGVSLSTLDQSDLVALVVTRQPVPPLGLDDALVVALAADPFAGGLPTPVRIGFLSVEPPHTQLLAGRAAVELRLLVARSGGQLVPSGQFRLCAQVPCEPESTTPFQPMSDTGLSADGGRLSRDVLHYLAFPAFAGQGGGAFSVALEAWSTRGGAADDFEDGLFPEAPPYVFPCGDASFVRETGGVLRLRGPADPACGTSVAFEGALPGALSVRATFDFEVPRPCESVGITLGTDASRFPLDFAALVLTRDALELLGPPAATVPGSLVLRLLGEPETGSAGPTVPVVAEAVLSTAENPAADPALAGVTSIELALALEADGPGQRPVAGYRLCTASGCPEDPTPLGPPGFYAIPEILSVCGVPTEAYGPSADDGRLVTRELVGTALVATPEPAGGAAGLAAAAVLVALARRGRPRAGR